MIVYRPDSVNPPPAHPTDEDLGALAEVFLQDDMDPQVAAHVAVCNHCAEIVTDILGILETREENGLPDVKVPDRFYRIERTAEFGS